MVVFGSGSKLLMSHIPMFQPPHDFQLLFEVKLPPGTGPAPKFGDELYTFKPDPFDLLALRDGRLTSFKGTLYKGNFEAGGTPVQRNVTVTVREVARATQLKNAPALPSLEYLVFGTAKDAYLVHPITRPPDFDQVLKVKLAGSGLTDADLAKGLTIELPGRKNEVGARLGVGPNEVVARVKGTGKEVRLTVERELSSLVGPDFTEPPPPLRGTGRPTPPAHPPHHHP
jgi:hypothetical protein